MLSPNNLQFKKVLVHQNLFVFFQQEEREPSEVSESSESGTLMTAHAMKLFFYTINLGTEHGQKLHTCHLGNYIL